MAVQQGETKRGKGLLLAIVPEGTKDLEALAAGWGWRLVAPVSASATASDAAGAAEAAERADAVLLDARCPAEAALARLASVRGAAEGAPCVALVDAAHAGEAARLYAGGVAHILPWPVDEALLDATVRTVSARRGASRPGRTDGAEGLDPLTGLVSRAAARGWLDERLRAPGTTPVVACLLIGISQFDSVNAAYGKPAGDTVLARVGERIAECVGAQLGDRALIARMGGTEYLVVATARPDGAAPDPDKDREAVMERARDLARALLSDVTRPLVADEQVIRLTARCGIAEPAPEDDAARLLRRASAALADARRSSCVDICERSGDVQRGGVSSDFDQLDADLRLAIDRGEIAIVYQPQYAIATDRLVGVEALARWNHPQLGQLDAGTLFRAADRSDYLLPLSLHIQRTALTEAGAWPETLRDVRLSVNVTAADLAQDDFVTLLFDMIDQSGFPRDRLTVEITESGLIENIDRAADILTLLREQGLRVAIDDFGTGYSSLAYLKALHPDYLKIDYGLSRDIVGAERDRIIVRAIIAMARSLTLTVIAEGVESEEQRALLAREGCDIYQGFLRSRGVTGAELIALVERG